MHQTTLSLPARTRGLHDITGDIAEVVAGTGVRDGLCHVFIHHTSASLTIQENSDPDVCRDLEVFFRRLVPDGDPLFRHVDEGPDDMPSHVRSAMTAVDLTIPVIGGRLALGTWQGVFLWEHREHAGRRRLTVTVQGS